MLFVFQNATDRAVMVNLINICSELLGKTRMYPYIIHVYLLLLTTKLKLKVCLLLQKANMLVKMSVKSVLVTYVQ